MASAGDSSPHARPGGGPLLVVISGPSGSGKDSVLARLRERGLPFHFTVTATTRPQREIDPSDRQFLMFLTPEEFDALLSGGGLLEHAEVYGNRYGVPKAPVEEALAAGKDVIVRVDVQGAATIRRLIPSALLIFLAPPSLERLAQRLRQRGLDDDDAIERRMAKAREEMARSEAFDYTLVNEDDRLDDTVDRLLEIIQRERARPGRTPVRV